jgi:deoxyribodipyrimidine photo-lyase
MKITPGRIRLLKEAGEGSGPVVYWMSRDQRARDNWALLHAQDAAIKRKAPLLVIFCLAPEFLGATIRQYGFMLKGLRAVEESLAKKAIPFVLLTGDPGTEASAFVKRNRASLLVTDFSPLRIKKAWDDDVARDITVPFCQVDAHNIVPCWRASQKLEYAAYTIRPRIHRLLDEYLVDYPALKRHPHQWKHGLPVNDWTGALKSLKVDRSVPEVGWIKPGEAAARRALRRFINGGLDRYAGQRNDPNSGAQSNLSPYLHFGQISAQRCALEVMESGTSYESRKAFLEELIVRRELADNFCHYNLAYDSFGGFPEWGRKTLDRHRKDVWRHRYRLNELENAGTHDGLWNAAQREMLLRGKMHGYLRMYWAKKILEWSGSPEEALALAIYLNDRYEIDGRDPNGYAGIAWSIGGVHDRAWPERPVFGKIRYMSYSGCRSKFDIRAYEGRVTGLEKS